MGEKFSKNTQWYSKEELLLAENHREKQKEQVVKELNTWTPLAEVIQGMVVAFLDGPTTLLVADSGNHAVLSISLEDYSVRTLSGQVGKVGENECGVWYSGPACLAVHKPTRSALVGDGTSIWRVNANGETSCLLAKAGEKGCPEGALTEVINLAVISGAVVVGADLIVSDCEKNCLRHFPLDGRDSSLHHSLFAGHPRIGGLVDGPSAKCHFRSPAGLSSDSDGNVFVADEGNCAIRMVSPTGKVTTLAGCGERGYREGAGSEARFFNPTDCAWDGHDNLIVADSCNNCLRLVNIKTGRVSALAAVEHPQGVVVNHATGDIFVSCKNNTIRRISPDRNVTTVCGVPGEGHEDGTLNHPRGLALL